MKDKPVKEYVIYMYYKDVPHVVFQRRHYHKGKQFKGNDKTAYENQVSNELLAEVCIYHVRYLRTVKE